jgi:putative RecB family exonuclease
MIGTALKCGERFRRRYIEGERSPSGVEAARGQGVHAASKVNLRQKVVTGVDLPLDDLKDAARDGYVKQLQEGVYLAPDDVPYKDSILNAGLNEAIKLTGLYAERVAPGIQPIRVEERFTLDIGLTVPLGGIMDFEEAAAVGDLKTAGKPWPAGRPEKEIQAKLYSYVFEKKTGTRPVFRYQILICNKKNDLQTLDVNPTIQDYRAMLLTVRRFWMTVQAGVFLPAEPGAWWCSEKWCPYFQTCEFVGNGQQKKWV